MHLVSYEGLAAGNVVINASDDFSMMYFMAGLRTDRIPPFVRVTYTNLVNKLYELEKDRDLLADIQIKSYKYFQQFMTPKILIKSYIELYA